MRGKHRRRRQRKQQEQQFRQELLAAEEARLAQTNEDIEIPRLPFYLRYSTEVLCVLVLLSFISCIFSMWFAVAGIFFSVLMWWNRNHNPAVRQYIDAIESREPLPGPEEPGITAYKIAYGLTVRDHYRNVPAHLRRKSLFGKYD